MDDALQALYKAHPEYLPSRGSLTPDAVQGDTPASLMNLPGLVPTRSSPYKTAYEDSDPDVLRRTIQDAIRSGDLKTVKTLIPHAVAAGQNEAANYAPLGSRALGVIGQTAFGDPNNYFRNLMGQYANSKTDKPTNDNLGQPIAGPNGQYTLTTPPTEGQPGYVPPISQGQADINNYLRTYMKSLPTGQAMELRSQLDQIAPHMGPRIDPARTLRDTDIANQTIPGQARDWLQSMGTDISTSPAMLGMSAGVSVESAAANILKGMGIQETPLIQKLLSTASRASSGVFAGMGAKQAYSDVDEGRWGALPFDLLMTALPGYHALKGPARVSPSPVNPADVSRMIDAINSHVEPDSSPITYPDVSVKAKFPGTAPEEDGTVFDPSKRTGRFQPKPEEPEPVAAPGTPKIKVKQSPTGVDATVADPMDTLEEQAYKKVHGDPQPEPPRSQVRPGEPLKTPDPMDELQSAAEFKAGRKQRIKAVADSLFGNKPAEQSVEPGTAGDNAASTKVDENDPENPFSQPITHDPEITGAVQEAFKGAGVVEHPQGWDVTLTNGKKVAIRMKPAITDEFGRPQNGSFDILDSEGRKLIGSDALMELSQPYSSSYGDVGANRSTVLHETLHAARQLGLFTDKEWKAMVDKYAKGFSGSQAEEMVARAAEKDLPNVQPKSTLGKVVQWAKDLVRKVFDPTSVRAESMMKALKNGDLWERDPGRTETFKKMFQGVGNQDAQPRDFKRTQGGLFRDTNLKDKTASDLLHQLAASGSDYPAMRTKNFENEIKKLGSKKDIEDAGKLMTHYNQKELGYDFGDHPQVLSDLEAKSLYTPKTKAIMEKYINDISPEIEDMRMKAGLDPSVKKFVPGPEEGVNYFRPNFTPTAGDDWVTASQSALRAKKTVGTMKRTGEGTYENSLSEVTRRGLSEAGKKAALNEVYRRLSDTGLAVAAAPGKPHPEGMSAQIELGKGRGFYQDLVKTPDDKQIATLWTTPEIYADITKITNKQKLPDGVPWLSKLQAWNTGAQLTGNTNELFGHLKRQLSVMSKMPPGGTNWIIRALEPFIPRGPQISSIGRAVFSNFDTPERIKIMNELAKNNGGSNRGVIEYFNAQLPDSISGNKAAKAINAGLKIIQGIPHEILFGTPQGKGLMGWDLRMRVLMEEARRAIEVSRADDPERMRDFGNQLGQYTSNPSNFVAALKKINPFAATSVAMRWTELKQMVGDSGLRGGSLSHAAALRVETLMRGPINYLYTTAVLQRILTGKWPWESGKKLDKHVLDVPTGEKDGGKDVYIDSAALDPGMTRAARTSGISGAIAAQGKYNTTGGKVAAALQSLETSLANDVLETVSSPLSNTLLGLGLGKIPVFNERQELMSIKGTKDEPHENLPWANLKNKGEYAAKQTLPFYSAFQDVYNAAKGNPEDNREQYRNLSDKFRMLKIFESLGGGRVLKK